jgi:hypothetical protein
MPLQSNLFKNDTKLEACLVSDPDHVTPGSVGEHVSKIQQALFMTNNAIIDSNELGDTLYGPSTAQAVLAFKGPPRNILGPGQVMPDNIVGKRTIATLDAEMVAIEHPPISLEIQFGSISWIEPRPNPVHKVTDGIDFNPNWIPKAALGLMAVSNTAPPATVSDFQAYKGNRDFRAMTFCSLHVDIDGITDTVAVEQRNSFAESGFTPPFSIPRLQQNGVAFGIGDETALDANIPAIMRGFLPGETSSVSAVVIGARHPNTAIENVPADQPVLFNGLAKVRANPQEDAIGVSPDPGVPFHVPWVWCEMLVTYAGQRNFNVFGRGSIFPSHSWFANGTQLNLVIQSSDTSFLVFPGTKLIRESDMILPFFFKKGASASGPQTMLASESGLSGPVDTHPNTAPGGTTITSSITI